MHLLFIQRTEIPLFQFVVQILEGVIFLPHISVNKYMLKFPKESHLEVCPMFILVALPKINSKFT